MKIFVPILLSLVAEVFSNLRQPREIAQRRQFLSYTNNVIHENPNYPDQAAQSTVKVNFNPNQAEVRKPVYSNTYQQEFAQPYTQNYPTNSQLFNVGYSVRFTNGNKPVEPQPKYRSKSLDEGEIITGRRKQNEEVEVPAINAAPQEYIPATLLKKQKISGIKPKPHYITNYPNPKVLLSQANLSPVTQKYYKTLEQLKPQIQNTQELQQKYSWRNLSPGVEIIRSTEVPTGQRYTKTEQPVHFDHARALGRSQDFDYSNAVDSNNTPQQTTLFYNARKVQPQPEKTQQIPLVIGENVAKLPFDTSLLREHQIPIDTRLLEEAMRNQAVLYNPKYPQNQEQVQEVNYLQQAYRTIPVEESTQTKPVQVVYRQEQPQGFQDFQPDQNRFQLKVYGKPHQLLQANSYEAQDEQIKRQPRYLVELHTNLRPPPFDLAYQRRIRVG